MDQEIRFNELLKRLRSEAANVRKENRDLKRTHMKLSAELEKNKKEQIDIFSDFSQTERIALKNRVGNLIKKIDAHLDS